MKNISTTFETVKFMICHIYSYLSTSIVRTQDTAWLIRKKIAGKRGENSKKLKLGELGESLRHFFFWVWCYVVFFDLTFSATKEIGPNLYNVFAIKKCVLALILYFPFVIMKIYLVYCFFSLSLSTFFGMKWNFGSLDLSCLICVVSSHALFCCIFYSRNFGLVRRYIPAILTLFTGEPISWNGA